jgi:uncharacterized coiled-coil DUF342 family protein
MVNKFVNINILSLAEDKLEVHEKQIQELMEKLKNSGSGVDASLMNDYLKRLEKCEKKADKAEDKAEKGLKKIKKWKPSWKQMEKDIEELKRMMRNKTD